MADKKNITLSVDRNKHTDFKVECTINGADMSETVEEFMDSYVKASRELRSFNLNKSNQNDGKEAK